MAEIIASTQAHLDIEDIRDDIVILKNGNASIVLQTSAVNFDLLSEGEQDAMIFAFAALLNSLTFPIQIVIRSKRMDISNYIRLLNRAKESQQNTLLAKQIDLYEGFIRELVSKNEVLDKRFYVVIPYTTINLAQTASNFSLFSFLLGRRGKKEVLDKWHTLEKARINLSPKREHVMKLLSRVGLKAKQLTTPELVELFYDTYNPTVAREQKVALATSEYSTPLVEPALEPILEATEGGSGGSNENT